MHNLLPRLSAAGFDLDFRYHADSILVVSLRPAATELDELIDKHAWICILELVQGGGGEARVTQRLRRALAEAGWSKRVFRITRRIDGEEKLSRSHTVDHVKQLEVGALALEIEWNNKDPFFDRDLDNFSRLHAEGALSAGIIVTRGRSLQDGLQDKVRAFAERQGVRSFKDLQPFGVSPTARQRKALSGHEGTKDFAEAWARVFVQDKFGASTTHWAQLMSRLDRGVGSPCPLVAIGIPIDRIVERSLT